MGTTAPLLQFILNIAFIAACTYLGWQVMLLKEEVKILRSKTKKNEREWAEY